LVISLVSVADHDEAGKAEQVLLLRRIPTNVEQRTTDGPTAHDPG
jgi:hypothetical protein